MGLWRGVVDADRYETLTEPAKWDLSQPYDPSRRPALDEVDRWILLRIHQCGGKLQCG